ncbi:transglycosylase domain-containing protein [Leucobacter sp. VD1]|uniref:transglycosylase domain-containing protein n=1 Tax=Leucobacter sp. VD1 TaxID=3080381 RepID=UPI00301792CD
MTRQTSQSARVRTFKPRSAGGALGGILGAVAMSVIAGVLVTAAVTPVVALSGHTAKTAVDIFEKLPGHLDPGQLAQPSTLYAKGSDGADYELATFYDQNREMVGWDAISQYVKDAAVAEEDPRFYTHGGVDILATSRAVLQNAAGQNLSGASTITMQFVRNVLIQEAYSIQDEEARDKAYEDAMRQDADRKLKEMRYAISIEKQYPKDEILLGYLNIALFGRQIYGIESAAQYYYGKSAKDVSLAEAASLVAIVNNPSLYQLDVPENLPANLERRNKILDSMFKHGKITEAQHAEAIATPIEPQITPRVAGCFVAEQNYGLGHFCDYVLRYIKQDPNFGSDPAEREFRFRRGGFKIYTTIDLDIQAAGLAAIRDTVPALMDGIKVGAASVSTQVGTGRVLGMVQNRPFNDAEAFLSENPGYTTVNYNTDFDYGGSNGFQVGSTFKPITLAEWIRTGHSVRDIVQMDGRTVQLQSFRDSCSPDGVYGYGPWTFQNDNLGVRGNRPVLTAITQSVNGGIVSMQQKMDLCDTYKLAEKLGIHRASKQMHDQNFDNYGTTKLTRVPSGTFAGTDEIAPITMASAFAAFAGNGTVCTPVPIDQILDTNDEPVPFTKTKCTEGVAPEVASGVAYALEETVKNGLARHARSPYGVPHLAKTGTTDDIIDNWTVGASTTVATATWVGNADPICYEDGVCERVSTQPFGNLMFADQTIWPAMMNVADQKYGGTAFPQPSSASIRQTMVTVPDTRGKSFDEATKLLTDVGLSVSDGGEIDSSIAQGLIARSDPDGGASVALGSGITLYRSNGQAVVVPDGLVGATGADAEARLRSAGLNGADFSCQAGGKPDPKKDLVASTDPASGAEARGNSKISVVLACADKG